MEAIAIARSKREAQFARAREEIAGIGLNETLREEILSLSLRELRDSLQQGKFTAVQVLCAYVGNALEVQARTNCITALFTEAFDEARQLDERYPYDGDGAEKPPLFGLPFSVKGNFFVAGYDSPSGFIQFLDEPQSTTNSLVAHLRQLGGVPFAHTNVPQGLLYFLCTNPIYGTTTHPTRDDRTPGGTSGGEAALVAGGGAPFGIGADSGGSTRVPAAFCGLVTLKSCAERLRLANARSGMPGTWGVARGYSFITPQVEDQRLLLEHIYGSEAYGKLAPPLLPLPFNHELAGTRGEKIRIGYFLDDGFLPATPGCRRVVAETVAKLAGQGHEIVPFPLPEPETAALLVFKAMIPDGGAYYRACFAKEPIIDPCVQPFVYYVHGASLPAKEEGSPQARIFNTASRIKDAADVTELQGQIDAYTARFHSAWRDAGLEALICPVFSLPAVGHSYPHRLPYCRFTPAIWNVLNLPAGVVPAGEWSEGDEAALHNEREWPTGENDVLKLMREAATDSVGLPLSVQVVALPYREEVVLRVMAEVEGVWKNREAP